MHTRFFAQATIDNLRQYPDEISISHVCPTNVSRAFIFYRKKKLTVLCIDLKK